MEIYKITFNSYLIENRIKIGKNFLDYILKYCIKAEISTYIGETIIEIPLTSMTAKELLYFQELVKNDKLITAELIKKEEE